MHMGDLRKAPVEGHVLSLPKHKDFSQPLDGTPDPDAEERVPACSGNEAGGDPSATLVSASRSRGIGGVLCIGGWDERALAALCVTQQLQPRMRPRHDGTVVFVHRRSIRGLWEGLQGRPEPTHRHPVEGPAWQKQGDRSCLHSPFLGHAPSSYVIHGRVHHLHWESAHCKHFLFSLEAISSMKLYFGR